MDTTKEVQDQTPNLRQEKDLVEEIIKKPKGNYEFRLEFSVILPYSNL